ncbi:TPM domain-containing protein [Finegoldia sp. BIOML-A3]|uniref:TPM domain-containing protein n=1 Tax=Finegoldia TaxID=150022 RepID=UPI0012B03FF0|nr:MULTISPECIES: TPM domain-containing protein [unclassified Finegoldia]MSA98427.1 TPM domain-containing protein [Finegoldia sp. BIOML-A3]MSB92435.1 TPM domain-containing protein [Finegoldia sp. BIOML-A4]
MRKQYRLIFSFVLAFLLIFNVNAFAQDLPKSPDTFYLDEMGVISQEVKDKIVKTNVELEQKTGSQVLVVTIKDLKGRDPVDYGVDLFNKWKIGDATKKNGVLILLSQDLNESKGRNRHINIITGYGIEGRLNDGKVGRIIDEYMLDDLKDGNYSNALQEGFNAVVSEVAAEYDVELTGDFDKYQENLNRKTDPQVFNSVLRMVIILLVLYFISRNNRRNNRHRGRRRGGTIFFPGFGGGFDDDDFGGFGGGFGGGSSGGFGGFSGGGGSSGGGGAGRSF